MTVDQGPSSAIGTADTIDIEEGNPETSEKGCLCGACPYCILRTSGVSAFFTATRAETRRLHFAASGLLALLSTGLVVSVAFITRHPHAASVCVLLGGSIGTTLVGWFTTWYNYSLGAGRAPYFLHTSLVMNLSVGVTAMCVGAVMQRYLNTF